MNIDVFEIYFIVHTLVLKITDKFLQRISTPLKAKLIQSMQDFVNKLLKY